MLGGAKKSSYIYVFEWFEQVKFKKIKVMKKLEKINRIKNLLETKKIEFTINGIKGWGKKEDGEYGDVLTKFTTSCEDEITSSIYDKWNSGMNVNKFGPTCVTLYSYDMLKNKTTSKIKYEDVTIIKESYVALKK